MSTCRKLFLYSAIGVAFVCSCDEDPSRPRPVQDTRVPDYYKEWNTDIVAFAVDGDGAIHVAPFETRGIARYSREGDFVDRWYVVAGGDTIDPSALTFVNHRFVALGWSKLVVLDEHYETMTWWPELHSRNATSGGDLIAADSAGNIYVIDENINRVVVYALNGTFEREWVVEPLDSLVDLSGIAVTAQGIVCVSRSLRNQILMYTSEGRFLRKFGSYGNQVPQFDAPLGIDVNNDVLYVADAGHFRVKKFTLWGTYLSSFYSLGTYAPEGILDVPRSVAVNDDQVFVMHQNSIIRFDYSD